MFNQEYTWARMKRHCAGAFTLCRVVEYGHATWQKLLGICCKINLVHIKTEFFANYISVYKNCEWEIRIHRMPCHKLRLTAADGKYQGDKSLIRPTFCRSNFHAAQHSATCRTMQIWCQSCAAMTSTLFLAFVTGRSHILLHFTMWHSVDIPYCTTPMWCGKVM